MKQMVGLVCVAAVAFACSEGHAKVCDGFQPTKANELKTCSKLWRDIGAPDYADAEPDQLFVCHTRYVLSHNNERKTPDWVLEQLTREQADGKHTRPEGKRFVNEDNICEKAQAHHDYSGSGFDRGHMAPSGDFKSDADLMEESFTMSNVVPQVGREFNQAIWKQFEALVKKVAINRGTLYVITGPIYTDEAVKVTKTDNACGNEFTIDPPKREAICGSKKSCGEQGIAVPAALFKVLYDPKLGRANAYVMPNIKYPGTKKPEVLVQNYRTTVRVVETLTGLQMFNELPTRTRRIQTTQCVPSMFH